jgi:acyl-CoA synthetase (AMP-forming)/AMP-acid ligase II
MLADVVTSDARRASLEVGGQWNATTLVERVLAHAADAPERPAVIDLEGTRTASFGELAEDVLRLAGRLRALEVRPGDVVSVQMPNWYETVVIDLAVLAVGGVLNTMLPIYRARELRHMLSVGRVRVLFTPRVYRRFDHAALAGELRDELPELVHTVVVDDPHEDTEAFRRSLEGVPVDGGDLALDAASVSELLFTSGTEAAPKAIMHTEQTAGFGVRTAAAALGLGDGDAVWMPSPIGHSTGFNFGVRLALHHGLPVVLQDVWSPADAVRLVEANRCTYTVAATTFVSDLVNYVTEHPADLTSLRLLGSGGAPVPPEIVVGAARHGATVLRMYGSTEALAVTWNRPESPLEKRLSTDGLVLGGVEVETRTAEGEPVIGSPGEIFVRSPSGAVGFFDDPDRTAATWDEDGWIKSGDLGVLDDEGYLSIVGRTKEIIIRGGLNIAPREIEDVILQHDDVLEAAVIGLPDPRLGERTCACVVLRESAVVELDDLVSFLRDRGVANYKLPQRLVVKEALPKTPTGKVRKQELVGELS